MELFQFCPAGNGPDCGGTAFISFCKNTGWDSIGISLDYSNPLFRTQRFTAEWGGLLHDVWDLRTVDNMKHQSAVRFDNYL